MVFLCYRSSPPNMGRTISKTIKNITRQERDTEIAENGTEGGDGTTEDVWRRVSSPGQETAWWKAGREVWDSQAPSETWRSPSDRLDLKMLEGRVLARDLKEPRAGSYYLVVKAQSLDCTLQGMRRCQRTGRPELVMTGSAFWKHHLPEVWSLDYRGIGRCVGRSR